MITDQVLEKLIIARDMTPDQRAEAKELLNERRRKQDNGENVFTRHEEVIDTPDGPPNTFQN